MPFYDNGPTRIYYEESGSGLPILMISGGGLNSNIESLTTGATATHYFPAAKIFSDQYRCIVADLRNSEGGQSYGPLEADRPWDSFTDDHVGLMDHLGIDKFVAMGFCIGGPLIWNLIRRAPDRVVAGVLVSPSGSRPELRDYFYENNMKSWAPALVDRQPERNIDEVERFLAKMYRDDPDFVFTVTRDFVRECQTPILVLPDEIPAHPYEVAMETVMLAPQSEVSVFPWREPPERIPVVLRQIRSFLKAHCQA